MLIFTFYKTYKIPLEISEDKEFTVFKEKDFDSKSATYFICLDNI